MQSCILKYKKEKGKIVYSNGDIYEGELIFGMKHGYGKLIEFDGIIYSGEFMFDKKEGEGKTENTNCKCRFFGLFKDNEKAGFGRRISCLGDVIDGDYINDEITFGTIYFVNGNRYFGQIESLRANGEGEMYIRETKITETGIWNHGEKASVNKSNSRRMNLHDPEADVMNSFKNGTSDNFGY